MTAAPRVVAIVQSSYIPWKGYFDLMRRCDHFVFYDDAQYTTRDWRNRNRIKTKDGVLWLSIPVEVSGRRHQPVKDVRIADPGWSTRHWRTIAAAYARAPHFRDYRDRVEALYRTATSSWLSEVNAHFIDGLGECLGVSTTRSFSSGYTLLEGRTTRLLGLCQQLGATMYLSGPAARAYLDESAFRAAGIQVLFMEYGGYAPYPQLHPPFEHTVSVLDLLLNTGPAASRYLLPSIKVAAT